MQPAALAEALAEALVVPPGPPPPEEERATDEITIQLPSSLDRHWQNVYDPAEDTFLLVDSLVQEEEFIKKLDPLICLEIGCGSGYAITFLAKLVSRLGCRSVYFATDLNNKAASFARGVFSMNRVSVETVVTNLTDGVQNRLEKQIDILLFNPPYVVTPSEEVGKIGDISAAWAGGIRGREVIDQFLPLLSILLSKKGVAYVVLLKQNDPEEIQQILQQQHDISSTIVLSRRCGIEELYIVKAWRS